MPTIISGVFPLSVSSINGGNQVSWINKNSLSGHKSWSPSEQMSGPCVDKLNDLILQNSTNYIVGSRPFGHLGPYMCVFSGTPNTRVPDKYVELFPKVKTNTGKAWRTRTKTDVIIVTNLNRGNLRFTYNNGYTVEELGPVHPNGLGCSLSEFIPREQTTYGPVFPLNGFQFEEQGYNVAVQSLKLTETLSPLDFGWNDSDYVHSFKQAMLEMDYDASMTTELLAKANSGTLDLLTSVAEFPETVRSLYDLIKRCLDMYKDAKHRAFRLYDKVKKGQNQSAKTIRDIMDAITEVWMTYRYAIMPNVYMIEDIYETIYTKLHSFIRFRETTRMDLKVNGPTGFTAKGTFDVAHRGLIKRLVALNVAFPKVKHLMLTNVAVTAWELTPLSFVADWFLNIGDCLAALFVSPSFEKEGSTVSWQIEGTVNYVHSSGANVSVDAKAYRRLVIDPRQTVSLVFNPQLNWKRVLDALSLSWAAYKNVYHKR